MNQAIQKASSGLVHTEGLNETTLSTQQTVATVLAAQAKAEVEARFVVAKKFPRNWETVRQDMLKECDRPGFADGEFRAAWWTKPQGGRTIEGFTIGFAEMALRNMKNMDARSTIIFEDDLTRVIVVNVMDLESNISIPTTIIVEKTVERKKLNKGEVAISERINSYGKKVYLREATEDEILQKQNSAISKAKRNGILSLCPGDIQAECRQRILQIRHGDAAKDPKAFARKVIDGFGGLNVSADALEEYLGHAVGACSPEQLTDLRDIYQSIKDGKATWKKVVEAASEKEPTGPQTLSDMVDQKKAEEDLGYGENGEGKG